jgi:dolichol-phosphate mannosyltransferase
MQKSLLPVVKELSRQYSLEVIFIDDGSHDETEQALQAVKIKNQNQAYSVLIETHPVNKGLGAALRTGFSVSQGEVLVTTDSDATYDFSEIPALLTRLMPDVDMVTASPYHSDGGVIGVPAYRLLLSRGSSLIYRVLVDSQINTYTSLFRAYRRHVIEQVSFDSNGFLAGTEILVKAILKGYRVVEYPTILRTRIHGLSKAKLARTILAHLRFQVRVLLHRLNISILLDSLQMIEKQQ